MHVLGTGPPCFLKIRNQDRFFSLQRGARQDALGELQRRTVARRARRQLRGAQRAFQPSAVGGGADIFLGVAAEEHERRAIGASERADGLSRFVLRALPVIAVAHARRLIEHDHQLASAAERCDLCRGALRKEWACERRDDERNRRGAHQQQEPVTDPPPAHRLIRNLLDEHQRRKFDDPFPLALNQMHEDRDRNRAEADEEEGG